MAVALQRLRHFRGSLHTTTNTLEIKLFDILLYCSDLLAASATLECGRGFQPPVGREIFRVASATVDFRRR